MLFPSKFDRETRNLLKYDIRTVTSFDHISLFNKYLIDIDYVSVSSAPLLDETNSTRRSSTQARAASDDSSLGRAVVNTQELTISDYHGSQVYIYSAVSNENENKAEPQKWRFYYVPIMAPTIDNTLGNDTWIWDINSEIRLKLMLGNQEVQELARNAITKKYPSQVSQYSQLWTVAPLIIDSLMAYVASSTASPVQGVTPNRIVNPNSLTLTFRFECSSPSNAQLIMSKIKNGDYSTEIAFYFAGFKQVTTNLVSITADQLKNVLSKTAADGGNTNAQYIHRNQAAKFVAKYVTNVKKMIYVENANTNLTSLTNGLEDQFISMLEQGKKDVEKKEVDTVVIG
ncbi:unnamed protein product [Rotaria sordida]|uniref:Uncharacterized protein n=1 Tax=Rotaria sordida TaxID=392033 RepID=A0A819R1Q5_9BILA|nr:unnamed protein product [Rotaria sordida]